MYSAPVRIGVGAGACSTRAVVVSMELLSGTVDRRSYSPGTARVSFRMPPPVEAVRAAPLEREADAGLVRRLSAGQQAMMAIGGAIGTGLFLGSGLTVRAAGPGVILSYLVAATT